MMSFRPIDLLTFQLCLALLVALTACAGEGGRAGGAVVRDSAGIEIVENTAPKWPEGFGWRLSEEPTLEIGEPDGDPMYQFYEVADARRLSDGRIVAANSGTHELRFYSPRGQFLSASGREGAGPGEFQGLTDLWEFADDSLLTYDFRTRRVSVFDSKGAFARSFQLHDLTGARSFPSVIAAFADGSLLVNAQLGLGGTELRGGLRRDSTTYLRCDPEGALLDTVGWFPGPEWYVRAEERGMMASTRAFGRRPYTAAFAAAFYYGSPDSYEIARYDEGGRLRRLIRKAQPNLPVTAEDIELWKQEALEDAEDENQRIFWERIYSDMPFPETMPAYQQVVVDAEANLWVEEYRRPGDEQPRWTVFDSSGVMLGVVETPERFQVYQIGSDFVLGRWTDEFEVEYVQLYKLKK
ncbi:MAG: hypothetical protein JSV86_02610 [Gemmatimonadota bacterium]|nr:MAG: hypothetical protein JSV86_02610 [Gemmatimonadota bacterium]